MRVYFKDDTHQYFNEDGKQYISVSALAKKLEIPKDWVAIRRKYAKEHGLTVKQVKENWEKKRKLGSEAGTILHKDRENELLSTSKNLIICPIENGLKWSIPITQLQDGMEYPELIIYNHNYAICGQSDKVKVENRKIQISDIKTDKSIERKAFSNERVKPEKLLPPVSHLENCNFNVYSLKMSMYMYMLWDMNKHLKTGDLILEHIEIERDEEGIPVLLEGKPIKKKTTLIEVPYRRKEVIDIFEYYKNEKLK